MSPTALITGASQGIGLAIVQKLVSLDFIVYGVARSETTFSHDRFTFFQRDLLDEATLLFLKKEIRHLDVLINNAGVGTMETLENITEEQIVTMTRLNLEMPILLTRAFLPLLKKSQGHIINIGSESALRGRKNGTVYCATKFGLRGFSEALFEEVGPEHVSVSLINPGMVMNSFFDDKSYTPGQKPDEHLVSEDIAQAVADILAMRKGSVVREITILPQKKKIVFR